MEEAEKALLAEIRLRLEEARDDPRITNVGGSNYWGPYVTRAVDKREEDGPALVQYLKDVVRKSGDSQGWNALLEADRLDLSLEELVANADEPIRSLFDDEDREIAARALGAQQAEIRGRRESKEAVEVERDHRVVANVRERRRSAGKPWTDEMEARMLADRAAKRQAAE